MYGIYANIGGILMVNVTIYGIHGSYGYEWIWTNTQLIVLEKSQPSQPSPVMTTWYPAAWPPRGPTRIILDKLIVNCWLRPLKLSGSKLNLSRAAIENVTPTGSATIFVSSNQNGKHDLKPSDSIYCFYVCQFCTSPIYMSDLWLKSSHPNSRYLIANPRANMAQAGWFSLL